MADQQNSICGIMSEQPVAGFLQVDKHLHCGILPVMWQQQVGKMVQLSLDLQY